MPRFRPLAALAVLVGLAGCRIEKQPEPERPVLDPTAKIDSTLRRSAAGWNAGDLTAFMDAYAPGQEVTYVTPESVVSGHAEIRRLYAPRFAPGARRDSLRFADLQVRTLDSTHALGTAHWILYRNGDTTSWGPFTLVMERIDGAWKIIHDHSSSAPPPAPRSDGGASEAG